MTSAQVVKMSVNNNSSFQNYTRLDDHTIRTTDTPGFKPFTMLGRTVTFKEQTDNIQGQISKHHLHAKWGLLCLLSFTSFSQHEQFCAVLSLQRKGAEGDGAILFPSKISLVSLRDPKEFNGP